MITHIDDLDYKKLWTAVLWMAAKDYYNPKMIENYKLKTNKERLKDGAKKWFFNDNNMDLGSFHSICVVMGWSPGYVRKLLKQGKIEEYLKLSEFKDKDNFDLLEKDLI